MSVTIHRTELDSDRPRFFFGPANRLRHFAPLVPSAHLRARPDWVHTMFYRKNLYAREQVVRLVIGLGVAVGGFIGLRGSWIGYILIASGSFVALTGVLGFCPGCALAGRKLRQQAR